MIEVLPDMPEGVIGIRVSGRLRGDDLREFKLAMEGLLKTGEIRIVEVIASDYEGFGPGGLVEDLKLGFGALFRHHSAFKRIAVVSDKEWVAHTLTRWRGWSPASSPCSASTRSSGPRSGPQAEGRPCTSVEHRGGLGLHQRSRSANCGASNANSQLRSHAASRAALLKPGGDSRRTPS